MKKLTALARRGFTLIELLVVIGVLAVLLAIVLIAINPARQFSQANNTKRASDVNALLNAVHQYAADNKGNISSLNIGATATAISTAGTGAAFCDALVTQYLAALPSDPTGALAGNPVLKADCATYGDTGYTISKSGTDNRITVTAPSTELGVTTISVTR